MTFANRSLSLSSSLLALVLAGGVAHADKADDAFKAGRELVKIGRFAEACVAFEESQRLDPSLGTQFNIAQCDEKIGKLATAQALYREVIAKDTNATRKAAATDLLAKLDARLPKIRIAIEPAAPGFAITIAGAPLACTAAPCVTAGLDFGTYDVTVKAPAFRDATAKATIDAEGKTVELAVKLEPLPAVAPPVAHETIVAPVVEPVVSSRKTYAKIAVVGGAITLAGGLVAGLIARGTWNDATAVCGGSRSCDTEAETERATSLGDSARTRANLSTALVAIGGIAATAGVVLWLTAPAEHAVRVSVHASPDDTGVALTGRF